MVDMETTGDVYFLRFKRETIRLALSDYANSRIGSSAIHGTQAALDEFMKLLAQKAQTSLDEENKRRRDRKLPPRKTLERIDIERAIANMRAVL